MGFYSFVVFVEGYEIPLPEHMVVLEPGRNTFNAIVKDVNAFVSELESYGVRFIQKNNLDEPTSERDDDQSGLLLGTGICLETKAPDPELDAKTEPIETDPTGGASSRSEDGSE